MPLSRLAFLSLCCTVAVFPQFKPSERIVLPANKTSADIELLLDAPIAESATAKVSVQILDDSKGTPLSPQPTVTSSSLGEKLQLRMSNIFFWGKVKLIVTVPSHSDYTYTLQRGPYLASSEVHVQRGTPAELWLYNFDSESLKVRWRILSGKESICGVESDGNPRVSCDSADRWDEVTLGAVRSDRIVFAAPYSWFNPWKPSENIQRQAILELRFGTDNTAPLLRQNLAFLLQAARWDAAAHLIPSWLPSGLSALSQLLWVTFWVTFGAVLLMLAQVMIPNFRQCLRMETQIENLQESLRAISSRVGPRLYARCHRELDSLRVDLAMNQTNAKSRFLSWDSLALSGNTTEVNRLASVLPRIESRIRLTERLDESESTALESDSLDLPPSLRWNREKQLNGIRGALSRQIVTDGDEKSAIDSLDLLADPAASIKDLATELGARIVGVRRQFDTEPWKTKSVNLIKDLTGCAELLTGPPRTMPDGGWTDGELFVLDLAIIRLDIVYQMIALEALLNDNAGVRDGVLKKLKSSDPAQLSDARADLLKLSQGIGEADVTAALETQMWDTYSEPTTITDQDLLHVSLVFRNKSLNCCAARDRFQCFWHVVGSAVPAGSDPLDYYEQGWETALVLPQGAFKVSPEVYAFDGKKLNIQSATDTSGPKGVVALDVVSPQSTTLTSRLWRGLIDAIITAVVPVITVALTQFQTHTSLGIGKLILLGFTSQAVRAAILPESISNSPDPRPAKAIASGTR